ncbi:hypothetical protein Mp_zg01190 [Marchantia polymorpha subsp. ruderalis]|uniref:Uncharacterized protein n=3 Tax=Marchantia polymorpha TaxID=3197 RepID=A0A679E0Z7_MARPO|nr:hypothetical protein [Marchantia polymorpha]BBN09314.1 hypothetical protein Mp_4g18740 [Marchantia polymorpha subsp. ruderalis]AGB51304.1 hypothetical protein [Marchantia polymorpha]PTQ26490.1 hypothetical protein MARPO_1383s0001 [Marchantia polymorpha]PTQ26603.1 hypothetical protein MARPO_0882s0001 [Marchantia polymorpha]|eukprot:PTQ26490.1 hypothetical protein MARPO_1383s0001 [Marchantia polymorpha]
MDIRSEKLLKDTVRRILEHADLNIMNRRKVCSWCLKSLNVVMTVIDDFFRKNGQVPPWSHMPTCVTKEDAEHHKKLRHRLVVFAWTLY